jgi:basic membrane protein A and related proteins
MSQRRSLLTYTSAILGLVAALSLGACSQKEEAKPAPKADVKVEPKADAKPAEPAKPAGPFKVAFVYVGPVGDHGWSYAHDQGRKAVEKEFGDKVKTSFAEKVPEGADTERVVRDLASQGNDMIFATSFGYMEGMLKVAPEFPKVKFEHATGFKTADNMRVYQVRMYETAYLAGILAGKTTKTNKLGFVGSVGIPEVIRNANAFLLGAQSVNPKASMKVLWINSWFDPGKEKEAAETLIAQGADVLIQNTDSTAVVQTAEAKGKFAIGWDSDMSAFAPKAHLASSVINWGPYYVDAVKAAMDGSWKTGSYLGGTKEGLVDLISFNSSVSEDTKKLVLEKRKAIIDGTLHPFAGPLVGQDGKEQLAKDAKPEQKFLDGMMFFVKGVDGKIPEEKK